MIEPDTSAVVAAGLSRHACALLVYGIILAAVKQESGGLDLIRSHGALVAACRAAVDAAHPV